MVAWSRSVRPAAAALLLAASVAACGAPPPPPPTVVNVTITASDDVNATQSGQGAPVVLRVYQLGSAAGFEKAEFFRLLNADAATLGTDIVKKDEYLIAPGSKKDLSLTLPDTVKAIGLFAAYREFQRVTWRATILPEPHKTISAAVTLNASGLSAAAAP